MVLKAPRRPPGSLRDTHAQSGYLGCVAWRLCEYTVVFSSLSFFLGYAHAECVMHPIYLVAWFVFSLLQRQSVRLSAAATTAAAAAAAALCDKRGLAVVRAILCRLLSVRASAMCLLKHTKKYVASSLSVGLDNSARSGSCCSVFSFHLFCSNRVIASC